MAMFMAVWFIVPARAGIDSMIESVENSQVLFPRADSDVPFVPMGWASYSYYGDADFGGGGINGNFREQQGSLGGVIPVYAKGRNILFAGLDGEYTNFHVTTGTQNDMDLWALTPMAADLYQLGDTTQIAGFVAPTFTSALNGGSPWNAGGYAGVLGGYYPNDRLMWFYGGVYQYSFGQNYLYPYLGFNWVLGKRWNICMIVPWPGVQFAPNDRIFFSLGATANGADFNARNNGQDASVVYGNYNLMASMGVRLNKYLWLTAGVGASGFRSLQINHGGANLDIAVKSSPVFMISLEMRPTWKK